MAAPSSRHIEPLLPDGSLPNPQKLPILARIRPGRMFGPPVLVTQEYVDTVATGGTTFNQALDATVGNAASIVKSAGKILTASVGNAASMVRSVGKILTSTAGNSATMTKQVTKTLTTTAGNVAALTTDVARFWIPNRPLTLRLFPGRPHGPPLIQAPRPYAGPTYPVFLDATVGTAADMVRQVGKTLTAAVATVATLMADVARFWLGSQPNHPLPLRLFPGRPVGPPVLRVQNDNPYIPGIINLQTLTATVGNAASIIKSVTKTLTTTVGNTPSIVKSVGKSLVAACANTPTMIRQCGKICTATIGNTPSMVRQVGKICTATVGNTPAITKQITKTLTATIGAVGSLVAEFVITVFDPAIPTRDLLHRRPRGPGHPDNPGRLSVVSEGFDWLQRKLHIKNTPPPRW